MAEPIKILSFGYGAAIHWFWVLIVCALVTAFIFSVYFKERGNGSRGVRILLAFLRSTLCCMALLALLNWQVTVKKYRKSNLVVGFDSSASLQHLDRIASSQPGKKNGFDKDFKPSRLNVLKRKLNEVGQGWFNTIEEQFDIRSVRLGSSLDEFGTDSVEELTSNLEAADDQSKLDLGLSQILKRNDSDAPAAIVLFSDGLDSDDPFFKKTIRLAKSLSVPIYPVGLGEKEPADDLQMVSVQCNPKVFLNDLVEFRMSISADGYAEKLVRLQLIDEGEQEIVAEKTIKITSNQFRDYVRLRVRMLEKGTRKFIARMLPVEGEYDTTNNQKSIRVEVDSDSIKVLLAANYPSREFHFLKQFLGRESKARADLPPEFANNRIELNTFLQQADIEYANVDRHAIKIFPVTRKQLFEYDVVIFCDLKPNWAGSFAGGLGRNELDHLREFVEEKGGGLIFVAGSEFTPTAYSNSSIRHLFPVDLDALVFPEPDAEDSSRFAKDYSMQKTMYGKRFLPMELGTDEYPKDYADFAGSYWFATSEKTKPSAVVLAELVTPARVLPGIVMQKVGLGTVLYHATPETYRWRYRSSEVYFGRYWSQMIQFLASSKLARGNQSMVLNTDRIRYFRNETIQVFGQLLDRSMINEVALTVTVRNLSGYERTYQLRQNEESPENYSATLENLGAGSYEVFHSSEQVASAKFEILDEGRENQRRPINELGLQKLAQETGGKYLKIRELEELNSNLPERKLIEVGGEPPWIFWDHWEFVFGFGAVFVLVASMEWILRKKFAML